MSAYISKHILMRCGISPSEIDKLSLEEVIYFKTFYKEMKDYDNKVIAHEIAKVLSKMFGG